MKWQGLVGLSLIASTFFSAGCQSDRVPLSAVEPDLTRLLAMAGGEGRTTTRGQKPERIAGKPAGSALDLSPDLPGASKGGVILIAAAVNGTPILKEELIAAGYQGLVTATSDAERNEILNAKLAELIDREVVLQDAYARLSKNERFLKTLKEAAAQEFEKQWLHRLMRVNHYKNEEEFLRFLRKNGMPVELMRRQWERNFIAMEYLRFRIEPHVNQIGHLELVDYYDKHPDQFRVDDSVTWQDLFIAASKHPTPLAAKQFADSLAERVRKGEDFFKLAKAHDNGDSSFRDRAEGIGRKHGEIKPPEAEPLLFAMKDGEVRLLEMETGYHILRLVKHQRAGILPFDDKVQKEIKGKLRGEIFNREMKRIVADLKRKAVIEVAK
jgi:parvulin-like peptidyl-prolyl isomerase